MFGLLFRDKPKPRKATKYAGVGGNFEIRNEDDHVLFCGSYVSTLSGADQEVIAAWEQHGRVLYPDYFHEGD